MERRVASLEDYVKTQEAMKDAVSYTDYMTASNGETSEDTNTEDIAIPELDEKSVSIAQQRLFGQAWAVRSGKMKAEDAPEAVRTIVNSEISDEEIKKFAKTSHEGLPVHVENEGFVTER